MSDPLPQLLDCKALQVELGITRAAAEKLMRHLPVVMIEDLRKTYVRRSDVHRYLEARTFSTDRVPLYDELDKSNGRAPRERPRPGTGGMSSDASPS